MSSRVLIAGCGDVGGRLAARLVAAGHSVWGLRRDVAKLPSQVQAIGVDLTSPDLGEALPCDLDYVFYTAAAGHRSEAAYRKAYVDGLRNVLDTVGAGSPHLRRVFFTSSTSVYGQNLGEWVDESSPTEPTAVTGRIMVEAERLLAGTQTASTCVRFGGIYGPGRTYLLRGVLDGTIAPRAEPSGYTNRIHSEDCAGALHHLMGVAQPEKVYLAVDDESAPYNEVLNWIAERVGRTLPPIGELSAQGSVRGSKRCRNTRLRQSGYRFAYPSYRDGYSALIQDMNGGGDKAD